MDLNKVFQVHDLQSFFRGLESKNVWFGIYGSLTVAGPCICIEQLENGVSSITRGFGDSPFQNTSITIIWINTIQQLATIKTQNTQKLFLNFFKTFDINLKLGIPYN